MHGPPAPANPQTAGFRVPQPSATVTGRVGRRCAVRRQANASVLTSDRERFALRQNGSIIGWLREVATRYGAGRRPVGVALPGRRVPSGRCNSGSLTPIKLTESDPGRP